MKRLKGCDCISMFIQGFLTTRNKTNNLSFILSRKQLLVLPQKKKDTTTQKEKKLRIHAYFINHATIVKHHIQTSTRFIKNIFHFDTFQGDEKACSPSSKQFTRGQWKKKYSFLGSNDKKCNLKNM